MQGEDRDVKFIQIESQTQEKDKNYILHILRIHNTVNLYTICKGEDKATKQIVLNIFFIYVQSFL
jgi:hypothetical protein